MNLYEGISDGLSGDCYGFQFFHNLGFGNEDNLKDKDNLKDEDNLKNEDNLRNEDDMKKEDNITNEEDLKNVKFQTIIHNPCIRNLMT